MLAQSRFCKYYTERSFLSSAPDSLATTVGLAVEASQQPAHTHSGMDGSIPEPRKIYVLETRVIK